MSFELDAAIDAAAGVASRLVETGVLTGAVVAAANGSGYLAQRAVGTSAGGAPIAPDDLFLTTSITKAVTAIQVMRLVDDGLLDLRSRVQDHLPGFSGDGKDAVQVWHLLSHTAGLSQRANVIEGPLTSLEACELESYAIATPLSRPPGEVEYCSPGFWLLAAIIREITGEHHVDHLRSKITGAVGISPDQLDYAPGSAPPARLVPAIASRNEHLAEQVRRIAYPAGGIVATGVGLARLGAELIRSATAGSGAGSGLLSPAAVAALSRPWSRGVWPDGRPAVWGLGMELKPPGELCGTPTLFHSGASGVGWWIDLERGVSLAMLSADWYIPRTVHANVADAFSAALSRAPVSAGATITRSAATPPGMPIDPSDRRNS